MSETSMVNATLNACSIRLQASDISYITATIALREVDIHLETDESHLHRGANAFAFCCTGIGSIT